MDVAEFLRVFSIALIPVLFAITLHEVAHGWAARQFGDRTAELAGRLTLNPIKHIDPIGTVIVPIAMMLFTGFLFGWAKPVPVAFHNLRNPKRDMILVAAAGPGANLVMAMGWALFLAAVPSLVSPGSGVEQWLQGMCVLGIQINVILAVFNMLPIPPLDGGRVLAGLLPPQNARFLHQIEPFGFMIVVALMLTGVLWRIMDPFWRFFLDFFFAVGGLS